MTFIIKTILFVQKSLNVLANIKFLYKQSLFINKVVVFDRTVLE